jgi:hypothetical protein
VSSYVVKADPGEDWYVVWSNNVDGPLAWGTRAELEAEALPDDQLTPQRFTRADERGSSAVFGGPIYGWDHDGWIYEQRGVLPRRNLRAACERLTADEHDPITDLLEPFEDETEVRPA